MGRYPVFVIAGSRTITDYGLLCRAMGRTLDAEPPFAVDVISGGARGVDTLAERWHAEFADGELVVMEADWDQYSFAAGPIRNQKMADAGDVLVALWDGESSGTKNMIECAVNTGLDVHVYNQRSEMII